MFRRVRLPDHALHSCRARSDSVQRWTVGYRSPLQDFQIDTGDRDAAAANVIHHSTAMSPLILYQFATSPFCAKVRKILDFKGLDYRMVEVDYLERKELIIASSQIMVPALTLESGETIVDSYRIAMRLESSYPEPTIFPPEWRGVHL